MALSLLGGVVHAAQSFLRRFGELGRASIFWLFGCLAFASDVPTGETDFGLLRLVEGEVCGLPPGQGGPGALRRCLIICAPSGVGTFTFGVRRLNDGLACHPPLRGHLPTEDRAHHFIHWFNSIRPPAAYQAG